MRGLPKNDLWAEPARKFRSRHLQDLQDLSQRRKDTKALLAEKELRSAHLKEKLRSRLEKARPSLRVRQRPIEAAMLKLQVKVRGQ